ncbi:MAG: hypothetical protein AAF958_17970 [Planctomycetota bacterium]
MTRDDASPPIVLAAGPWRIEFFQAGDRFRHRLCVGDQCIAETIDDDGGDPAWPPSPPIQQLSKEPIGSGEAILGVGGAGTGHWSLSVSQVMDAQQNSVALNIEWACRTTEAPQYLGTRYRILVDHGDDRWVPQWPRAAGGTRVWSGTDEHGRNGEHGFEPELQSQQPGQQTVCWSYHFGDSPA